MKKFLALLFVLVAIPAFAGRPLPVNLQNSAGTEYGSSAPLPVQSAAGTAIIGKVGIDQTTDGTTNKIQARNATHDNLQVNANLQVGDADVSATNLIPVMPNLDTATGGTQTTLADTGSDFEADVVKTKTIRMLIGGKNYFRAITGNTIDTISFITLPGTAASVAIGDIGVAQVTITAATKGTAGNSYTVEFVLGVGNNIPLSAALVGNALTVTLATDGAGLLDAAANTDILVAAAIDALPEFVGVATGAGGAMAVTAATPLTGGVDVVQPVNGTVYQIMAW